eukprot:CAMPEP_0173124682 /NCGR_PEP_ID=MMETSP1102-20130122/55839_1 /TAXON_ID=49646 /ORGANISM="Geminigera sp., Strain Caron Lab Isolate" /LENGTH=99 /DNA_ID=CAMNT_0014033151 /DNA_START=61 /DNA_END=357 /DNA_ORIENTATION=+
MPPAPLPGPCVVTKTCGAEGCAHMAETSDSSPWTKSSARRSSFVKSSKTAALTRAILPFDDATMKFGTRTSLSMAILSSGARGDVKVRRVIGPTSRSSY